MADFIRMPDGSLILTGNRPVTIPTKLDRAKAAVSNFFSRFRPAPPDAPAWWIPQPVPPSSESSAPGIPATTALGARVNPFAEVEAESARQQMLAAELGPFATKVMASPQLIEGKWFSAPVPK